MLALTLCLLAGICAIVFCPSVSLQTGATFSTVVTASDGRMLRITLATDDRYRVPVSGDDIHPFIKDTTLLYEDRYFYDHPGFNPAALLRAAWHSYVKRTRPMGASTITMQLARMRFGLNTRTIKGKLWQIARAVQIERHYTKEEILNAYLNAAPYGGNIEGIGAASLIYFDKPVSELNLAQASALAVIPQNPVVRNPTTNAGFAQMQKAQRRLAQQLVARQSYSPAQITVLDYPVQVRSPRQLPFLAPHFVNAVLADNPQKRGGLNTSLEFDIQTQLEQILTRYVQRRHHSGISNASALLLDYTTMQVVGSVGSADFFNTAIDGQVNGTRAPRSPGSTLKPFVYGIAMDQGLIHPMSMLKDAPRRFGAYTPENFDRGFMGPITARDALVYSRNVPAIELLSAVGLDTFHHFLQQAGVKNMQPAEHYGLAMVLGGNEVTMEELVELYAMMANGGDYQRLRYLSGSKGTVVEHPVPSDGSLNNTANKHQGAVKLMSKEASFLVLDMLGKNPRPDSLTLHNGVNSAPVAWKTGTSYAYRDAWAVGVFDRYVLAVWVGNFDGSANPALIGRQAAAPLFFNIADVLTPASSGLPSFARVSSQHNLRKVDVCSGTGDLAGRHCPASEKSWFIPGKSPIKVSDVHRAIRINRRTGLRACTFDSENTYEAVYEFWPSDLKRLMRQAGIALRSPPGFDQGCELDISAHTGSPPLITSPAPALTYFAKPLQPQNNILPLVATTDSDADTLHWFVNNTYLGKVEHDRPLYWRPKPGTFDVLVVDDLGRSHSNRLTVLAAE